MRYTVLNGIRNTLLKTFIDAFDTSVNHNVNKLYLGLGKSTEWSDQAASTTQSTADNPYIVEGSAIDDVLADVNDLIKINSNDIIPVIPNLTFQDKIQNNIAVQHGEIIRSVESNAVYECVILGTTITEDPSEDIDTTHNNGEIIYTSDGFGWKYLWHLNAAIVERYMAIGESDQFHPRDDYMPVSYNLYHPDSIEYRTQIQFGISPNHTIQYTDCSHIRIKVALESDLALDDYRQISIIDSPLQDTGEHYDIRHIKGNIYSNSEYLGKLIYVCNRPVVSRHNNQVEEIKIILGM